MINCSNIVTLAHNQENPQKKATTVISGPPRDITLVWSHSLSDEATIFYCEIELYI